MSHRKCERVRGSLKGLRILVAEDNGIEAELLAVKLEEQGVHVVGPFASCATASGALKTDRIDFALVDLVLRDGPADALLETLADAGIPHIVITGFEALPTNAPETAVMHIMKPIDWHYLWTAITPFVKR